MVDELDTTESGDVPAQSAVPRAQTVIRWLGPGAPARYTKLARNRISLGRSDDADVRLDASGISRSHAEIKRRGPVYAISDKGSRNGTFVNGERIRHRVLVHNDVLHLGALMGVVLRLPASIDLCADDVLAAGDAGVFGPGLCVEIENLRRGADSTLPVVVVGETGVGKESIARALHAFSKRSGPFHAVNCAALPLTLAEAELFGHKKGAFTGAEQSGLGHIRAASGGTLFLDELADLPVSIQAKLLRVLQDMKVTPVGETRASEVNVRVVTACQTPLADLVREGKLREDLMMRLSGLTVAVPPLRLRRVDIGLLLEHFLRLWGEGRAPSLDPWAFEALLLHSWPGNVRELELCMRSLLALHGREPVLRAEMLPPGMVPQRPSVRDPAGASARPGAGAQGEYEALVECLRNNGGRVREAAKALGISRQSAYRLLRGRPVADVLAGAPEAPAGAGEEREPRE